MKVAIHQPNYLPWCGYFAKMFHCDVFVFLDDANIPGGQSFVSRTKIRNQAGDQWLTVPVSKAGRPNINNVTIPNLSFREKHLKTLSQVYRKAPYYGELMRVIKPAFEIAGDNLCVFNVALLKLLGEALGISAKLVLSSELGVNSSGDDRLVELVAKVGGSEYVSGPGGENYQNAEKFEAAGICLNIKTYKPIPYESTGFPFIPGLSVIDLLCILGPMAARDVLVYSADG